MENFSNLIPYILLVFAIGYLLGSISFPIIITKLWKNKDVRTVGSGNAGATNVVRAAGLGPALIVFALDFTKCAAAALIGFTIVQSRCQAIDAPPFIAVFGKYAAGIGCILGHLYPVFFGFRGGKGVTTAAALICLLDWRVFLPTLLVFILVFAAKRIISLASIIGLACYPFFTFIIMVLFDLHNGPFAGEATTSMQEILLLTLGAAIISAIIIGKHHENIKRLLRGEEKKLSFGQKN